MIRMFFTMASAYSFPCQEDTKERGSMRTSKSFISLRKISFNNNQKQSSNFLNLNLDAGVNGPINEDYVLDQSLKY